MHRVIPIFVLSLLFLPEATAQPPVKLRLRETRGSKVSFGSQILSVRWNNSDQLVVGRGEGRRFLDPETLEEVDSETEPTPSLERKVLEALEGRSEIEVGRIRRSELREDSEGRVIVASSRPLAIYRVDLDSKVVEELFFQEESGLVAISPDVQRVLVIWDYDLHILDLQSGDLHAYTEDGSANGFRNGYLDWVYQEEIYGRGDWRGYRWSPTGRYLAFLRLDTREVPPYTIVDESRPDLRVERSTYPKPGDPNPIARLGIVDTDDKKVSYLDANVEPGQLIVRLDWHPERDELTYQTQDRIQTELTLYRHNPAMGETRKLLKESSPSWVNVLEGPRFLEKGGFLWLSERTGFKHLYYYSDEGELQFPLTRGEWSIRRIVRVDEKRQRIWYTATRDGDINQHLYFQGFEEGPAQRLTTGAGTHRITLNKRGDMFIDVYESVEVPTQVRLVKDEGREIEILAVGQVPSLDRHEYVRPQLAKIPARDGVVLDAMIFEPAELEPGKRYPIWLSTYSGPGAPTVSNRWQTNRFDQYLVSRGIYVFKVNNRTSTRRGRQYVEQCYKNLGARELEDLIDALDWLGENSQGDLSRVGITGWSYGGFMTAYALTFSDRFQLGVAGAGVYDWRLYYEIYTERYMSTPELNPEGYERSSVIENADRLTGHLVLVHGLVDDNVHFENLVKYVAALQKAEASFEVMFYPGARHGLRRSEQAWSYRRLTWRAIEEQLLRGPTEAALRR